MILFHDELDASKRVERLLTLRKFKALLEPHMIPALQRTNCEEPGVSLVPITPIELHANIHKSGVRRFFDRNSFLDLKTGSVTLRLPGAGMCAISDDARQALEYVQKTRNQFLAVSANGTGGIAPFHDPDPLPKALARAATQLVPDPSVGAWYDTRNGLEYLFDEISRRRSESRAIAGLYRRISVRRGGRGRRLPLGDEDQMLLAEILYDRAALEPLRPLATWEIRFRGAAPDLAERERLLEELGRLVPDAEIMRIFEGSIIVRLRSSRRSYETVSRLAELGVLAKFFLVEEVDVAALGGDVDRGGFRSRGVVDRIADRIAEWRPQSRDSMALTEAKLAGWLESWLRDNPTIPAASITREARVRAGYRQIRADLLLQFVEMGQNQLLVIELARFGSRAHFFQQIELIRSIAMPAILVVVGTPELDFGHFSAWPSLNPM